jgi:transglutaminase-like putative cysteine protease
MKLSKSIFILLTLVMVSKTSAQEYKLGKVTVAELEEKASQNDPTANAAILYSKGKTYFEYKQDEGFIVVTEVETKIKIYNKQGFNWANKAISFYIGGTKDESVMFSKAITYNLVNGEIEKTKLKSEGEFIQKNNKFYSQKKITMPNVKEGSIIEYMYVIRSPYITTIPNWDFQESIPVNHSEFRVYIPEYFTYNPNQKGFVLPKITYEKTNKSFSLYSKELPSGKVGGYTNSSKLIEYVETITNYNLDNIPALKDESFVNNIDNYKSSISYELAMTKFPDSYAKTYATDWESVVKTIYDNDDFGLELNKTGYFEDDITKIVSGLSNQEEKIATIFDYVKSKITWNNIYGYYCDEGVKSAYKNNAGNVAEINLMLTAMLRFAGISANPVLVSTRSHGIAFFPNRTAYNYVIAAVEIQDGLLLLDATEKYTAPNVLPLRDLNWFGRLIRKDGSSTEVDLMPKAVSREVTNMNLELSSNGNIDGKIRTQNTNQLALLFRQKHLPETKDSYIESLEAKNNNIEISDYIRENDLDIAKPISESYTFKSSNNVEIIKDKIYISPLIFLATKENPFKQETREYPIDFGFPIETKYNINIKIPDGYTIESLPKAINIATGENVGSFKYLIANTDNTIQVVVAENINAPIVPSDFYQVLKDFFKQMVEKENEKIILKKI